ncbi:MAG: S-adenosylmethionine decarboxylase [Nanoarchaeota archaeon]|nr:S-adenosylmethionine decarboxylase [Nanoarchaeota archaeon]MBU1050943.1 S-adenosylmethionine decarboxylase [Nanoarchaeota archaeon]MBU1988664.1 S-adenosylmethionine decarboxylase [Nanoarchaeota archaeon]
MEKKNQNIWGQLSFIDLHTCNHDLMKDKKKLGEFCLALCGKIKMKPYGRPIVKRLGKGRIEGISAIMFIETSTITVHLDEFDNRAFIDIFSCKKFDSEVAKKFCKEFFKAQRVKSKTFMRG